VLRDCTEIEHRAPLGSNASSSASLRGPRINPESETLPAERDRNQQTASSGSAVWRQPTLDEAARTIASSTDKDSFTTLVQSVCGPVASRSQHSPTFFRRLPDGGKSVRVSSVVASLPTTSFHAPSVRPKCEPKPSGSARAGPSLALEAVGALTAVRNNVPYYVGGAELHRSALISDLDFAESQIQSRPLFKGLRPTRRPTNTIHRSRSVHVDVPSAALHYGLGADSETRRRPHSENIRFVSAGFCP
jgi:hypothetical protein